MNHNRHDELIVTKPVVLTGLLVFLAILAVSVLTGCAVAPRQDSYSLIDPNGVNMAQYQQDYDACAALANQTAVGDRAAGGAMFGALFSAVVGAALCGRNCSAQMAGWGAAGGATGAAGAGVREQQTTLRACLAGRGYRVIR